MKKGAKAWKPEQLSIPGKALNMPESQEPELVLQHTGLSFRSNSEIPDAAGESPALIWKENYTKIKE